MPDTEQGIRNIAVVRALQLGDLLCSIPAFRALSSVLPASRVTLVGLPWARSLVQRFDRYLGGFLEFPGYPGLPEMPADEMKLRVFEAEAGRLRFDLAIQMHGDGTVTNRFLRHIQARHLAGFCKEGEKHPHGRFLRYPDDQPEVLRLLSLMDWMGVPSQGEQLEFPIREEDDQEFRLVREADGLPMKPYVCLHPGARDASRRWPVTSFIALGRRLSDRGYHLVVTGTEGEREVTRRLTVEFGGSCTDLTGRTNLGALACLFKSSRLLVCNDTGVSHLAVALKVPSVVIFSGSDPKRWAPLNRERHRALGDPSERPGTPVTVQEAESAALSLLAENVGLRPVSQSSSATGSTAIDWKSIRRILAFRLDNIGDVILLGPALRALKSQVPGVHITLMASPAGSQAARLLPGVDEVRSEKVVWQDASFSMSQDPGQQQHLVDRIRTGSYDLALIFSSFSQSPYPPAFVCYLAGIPIRVGDSKEFGGSVLSHWVKAPDDAMHQAERNLHLLRAVGCRAPNEVSRLELAIPLQADQTAERMLSEAGVKPGSPFIAVVPGASCAARTYPFTRYRELVCLLGRHTAYPVVLLGSAREAESFRLDDQAKVATDSRVVSLVGRTTVPEFAAVLKRASLVIANNSSAVHMADAFSRPTVVLYSGTEYRSQWRPRFSLSRILTRPTVCSPCYQFRCPYQLECLEIPPEEVCREAISLLELTSCDSVGPQAATGPTGFNAGRSFSPLLVQEGQA